MKKMKTLLAFLLLFTVLADVGVFTALAEKPEIAAPEDRPELFGEFKSKTLIDGEEVDQTVFEDYTLVMVNIWGTFCNPCVKEMPELAEISREYAEKGFTVVGVPADITDKKGKVKKIKSDDALSIIEQTGADYMHIVPSREMIDAKLKNCQALPETVFVDSQGRQVGESYMGAKTKDEWVAIIDGLLEAVA